jgi:hypothetical protein
MVKGFYQRVPLGQMFRQRHHIAILLLSLGLVLLGIFLWLFLKKTWGDESNSLRQETNLLFVDAVHSIERKMFDKLIVRRLENGGGDTTVSISLHLPTPKHITDSAKAFALVQEHSIQTGMVLNSIDTSYPNMKFVLNTDHTFDKAEMSGTLSMFMTADSINQVCTDSIDPQILKSLELNFGLAIQKALPTVKLIVDISWRVNIRTC